MPHPSPYLSADRLGLTLPDGRRLFDGLDLSFSGERTGLVGVNGAGKSLLLDVLAGVRAPSTGAVRRPGRIAYVPQGGGRDAALPGVAAPPGAAVPHGAATPPDETVADRLGVRERLSALDRVLAGGTDPADYDRIGSDGWDLPERLGAELDRLGLGHLALDRPATALSGGEATRVSLAGALLGAPDLLVLDEPTNDLDAASRRRLLDALAGRSGGLLVVSHDRALLRMMDRILELSPAGVREYGGGYDAYRAQRDAEQAAARAGLAEAEAARRKARRDARRVRERQERRATSGRRSRTDGGMPRILLNARRDRSQQTTARLGRVMDDAEEAAAERVREAEARLDDAAALRMDVASSALPRGKDVLVLEDVAYRVPVGGRVILDGIDFVLRGPERVAIVGPNGSGKTTLLRLIAGALTPARGVVRVGVEPEDVAYLDQRVRILPGDRSVLAAFMEAHDGLDEASARHVLARYLFPGDAALAPTGHLSGGERMRAGLALVLGGPRPPGLLLLDEPTNHLDFASLETVERAVAAFDGALVVVSHDEDFLAAVGVERRVELRGPGRGDAAADDIWIDV